MYVWRIIACMRVLHLDSSARWNRSHTRQLSALVVEELRRRDPSVTVVRRDLAASPPPPITEDWIAAAFAKDPRAPKAPLNISDELIDELLSCDLYVFGVPMYNYSVPAVFKSYIDQIVRIGRTFSFDPDNKQQHYAGLIQGKRAVVITSRGDAGYGPDGPHWAKNHTERYIMDVFGFLGVEEIDTVAVEHEEFGGASQRASVRRAEERIRDLASAITARECCAA